MRGAENWDEKIWNEEDGLSDEATATGHCQQVTVQVC